MINGRYRNPWAERLSEVTVADGDLAWAKMDSLLDRELVLRRRRTWRRWLLLILLLLLLVGVCNCPGRSRFMSARMAPRVNRPTATQRVAGGPSAVGGRAGVVGGGAEEPPHPREAAVTTAAGKELPGDTATTRVTTAGGRAKEDTVTRIRRNKRLDDPTVTPEAEDSVDVGRETGAQPRSGQPASTSPGSLHHTSPHPTSLHHTSLYHTSLYHTSLHPTSTQPTNPQPTRTDPTSTQLTNPQPASPQPASSKPLPSHLKTAHPPAGRKDTAVLGKAKPASPKKQQVIPPQSDKTHEPQGGFMVGIGLNQFFPIGGQRGAIYNTDGLTGTLSDYLPVPMIRYYPTQKLYIQLEAQFNTPQATKKNLVFNSPPMDSLAIPGHIVVTSATIQQLYYFNIPLSFHYAITDNLNVGTGLQYSHLSNAIGNFDSTITNTRTTAVTNAEATKSFKNDSLFHRMKTNEIRFLIDASYTYKHFILGVRYNQALSRFIHIQLPTGGTTEARNTSLQLYLRYILWDWRKPLPPE